MRRNEKEIKEGTIYYKFKLKSNVPAYITWWGKQGLGDQIKSSEKLFDLWKNDIIEVVEQLEYRNGQWIKIK